ncbi:MAG: hypothetical protein M3405_06970 [Acidobacteriota bacterium]|jgi:hypothetical protein|nr:hypothetical protein [Acidobacteriota bacterium]
MSVKISQMTDVELRQMIGEIVEEKLMALLGDEEDDLLLKEDLQKRLLKQVQKTKNGERGEAFDDVVSRLGLS